MFEEQVSHPLIISGCIPDLWHGSKMLCSFPSRGVYARRRGKWNYRRSFPFSK